METITVLYLGKKRQVELIRGPFKMFANREPVYEGFVLPEPLDPYGEPYRITFKEGQICK